MDANNMQKIHEYNGVRVIKSEDGMGNLTWTRNVVLDLYCEKKITEKECHNLTTSLLRRKND